MQRRYLLVLLYLAIGFVSGALFGRSSLGYKDEAHMHDHRGGEAVQVSDGENDPEITMEITKDAVSGYNIHLMTKHFTFAPQRASGDHVEGEGHAHVYVNDEKITRLYGEWAHIALPEGKNKVEVSLNANDHREYADQYGVPIIASEVVVVQKEIEMN